MWPQTIYLLLLTLVNRRMPSRLATKRNMDVVEKLVIHKVCKARKKVKCIICKEIGHNKSSFPIRGPQHVNIRSKKDKD